MISTISAARAKELLHPRGHGVLFGDRFAFYPWMVDRHDEHLIGTTPAILGVHDVSAFHGRPRRSYSHAAERFGPGCSPFSTGC